MSDPYRRVPTRPLPRAELAPVESAPRDGDEETLVQCPICAGGGMVSAEVAVALERMQEREG